MKSFKTKELLQHIQTMSQSTLTGKHPYGPYPLL